MADSPLVIDMVCACGGSFRLEVSSRAPDSIFDVNKYCEVVRAWNASHTGPAHASKPEKRTDADG
jgi:hypothetical protein